MAMREDILARGLNPEDFPVLSSRPELWADLTWVWEAFTYLSSGRQMGFNGPQPIALSEILAYAEFRAITCPDEREELLHHVQKLDAVYLSDALAKSKAASKK